MNAHTPSPENETEATTSRIHPARLALRNFHSQWFLVPQGTGILAVMLHQLHYQFRGLIIISQILWVLTILMLASISMLYIARGLAFPALVRHQLSQST